MLVQCFAILCGQARYLALFWSLLEWERWEPRSLLRGGSAVVYVANRNPGLLRHFEKGGAVNINQSDYPF